MTLPHSPAPRFAGRTMTAAVFRAPDAPLAIEEVEVAEPGPGELLVRLHASGVCHSDAHVVLGEWSAPSPLVLGHEGAGVVEAVGEGVTGAAPGDHVVLSWCPSCRRCEWCLSGRPALCDVAAATAYASVMSDGTTRLRQGDSAVFAYLSTGTFGQYSVVPESGAVVIDSSIPLDRAAIVGCAVATGFGAAVNTARVPVGATVAVVGCGGVGLSIVQGARVASAASIIAIDLREDKLALARRVGATHTINGATSDPVAAVRELTRGRGVDFAFEAIGAPAAIEQAADLLASAGTLVIVGQTPEGARVRLDPFRISDRELRIIGSNYGSCRPSIDFPRILELDRRGLLDLEALITDRIKLAAVNDAFAAMRDGAGARSVIIHAH
jgi:S-(hydroxymethyl)glutathione dehydrogenase / alcohol dehydrogenase